MRLFNGRSARRRFFHQQNEDVVASRRCAATTNCAKAAGRSLIAPPQHCTALLASRVVLQRVGASRLWQGVLKSTAIAGRSRLLFAMLLLAAKSAKHLVEIVRRISACGVALKKQARAWLNRQWHALRSPDH